MTNSLNDYKLNAQTLKLVEEAKKIFPYSGKTESEKCHSFSSLTEAILP